MLRSDDHTTRDHTSPDTQPVAPIRRHPLRPPGSRSEDGLAARCIGCGDCVSVCPASILSLDPDGYPVLRGRERCGHCGLCADVCMFGAIELTARTRAGLALVMAIERGMSRHSDTG
jgi:ferredoxin